MRTLEDAILEWNRKSFSITVDDLEERFPDFDKQKYGEWLQSLNEGVMSTSGYLTLSETESDALLREYQKRNDSV
jgi:hypothetical protein